MEITKTQQGDELDLAVSGRLDTSTAPELEQVINESVEGVKCLRLDFSGLDYLSSAGLRVLLGAQKTMMKQGEMVLSNVNETIMEVFEMTGFADLLTIE